LRKPESGTGEGEDGPLHHGASSGMPLKGVENLKGVGSGWDVGRLGGDEKL
jgi:hypothetical protein